MFIIYVSEICDVLLYVTSRFD